MTRVPEGTSARARIFSPKAQRPSLLSSSSKRGWCCFCPSEAPPKQSKGSKALRQKPPAAAGLARPVSSGEAGSAPRIQPVPSYGPVSEARAFPKTEDYFDFRRWR